MILLEGVRFAYPGGAFELRIPRLEIEAGRRVAIIGPSGSGKTTLVQLIAGLRAPQAGRVRVGDFEPSAAGDAARRRFRATHIGFVFQEFELLEYLSVRDNILLPYRITRALRRTAEVDANCERLARAVGVADKLRRLPRTLSQGERQRVAIARALIAEPPLVAADEPTGNLDPATADAVLDLLLGEVRQRGATLLMVTHNHALLDRFDRVIDVTRLGEAAA